MSGSPAGLQAGKYQPLFELGRGGMSTVLLAVHRGPHGFVKLQVIKRLKPELAEDPEFLTMFQEEARLAARINHRNVVQTNEIGFDGDQHFIAMEYLDGQSFEAILRQSAKTKQAVPLPLQLRIVADALEGLHYAHELRDFDGSPLNPVHRDVSPHNIFVTYEGQVKVVDFGIAKAADCDVQTRTGVLKGKVAYMPPEQVAGAPLDRRADIFSVGVILWRVLTGVRLWRGLSDMEIIVRVERGEIPSPSTVRADLPLALVAICKKALARLPEDRYQTAAELQAVLEAYLEQSSHRPTSRSIATLLCGMFREDRERVAQAIETRLHTSEPPADIPELSKVLTAPGTGTPSMTHPLEYAVEPLRENEKPARSALVADLPANRRGSRWTGAAVAAALVAVCAGFLYERRSRAVVAKRAAEDLESPASAAPIVDSSPAYVDLRLSLTPPDAVVYVDDQRLVRPARFLRDGAAHRLRAQAAGFLPQVQLVTFDAEIKDVTFKLELPNVPRRRDARPVKHAVTAGNAEHKVHDATPVRPQEPPGAATTSSPANSATPTIDTGDPWRK